MKKVSPKPTAYLKLHFYYFLGLFLLTANLVKAQFPPATDVSTLTNPFSCTGEAYLVSAPNTNTSSTFSFVFPSTPTVVNSSFVFDDVTVNALAYNISVTYGYGLITGDQDNSSGPNVYDVIIFDSVGNMVSLGQPTPSTTNPPPAQIIWNNNRISSATGEFDTNSNTYYFLGRLSNSGTYNHLVSLDVNSMTYTAIALSSTAQGNLTDLAFSNFDGQLYGFSAAQGVVSINPSTGVVTDVTIDAVNSDTVPSQNAGGAWADATGTVYFYQNGSTNANRRRLVSFDPSTGIISNLGQTSRFGQFDATACTPPIITKDITPATEVVAGGIMTYEFNIINPFASDILVGFSDILTNPSITFDLGSLSPALPGGASIDTFNTTELTMSSITVPGAGTLTFTIDVDIAEDAASGDFSNVASMSFGADTIESYPSGDPTGGATTVTVLANVEPMNDIIAEVLAPGETSTTSIIDNDEVAGSTPVIGTDITINPDPNGTNPIGTIDPLTGLLTIDIGTPDGTYVLEYEICEVAFPSNCTIATVTITVGDADGDGIGDTADQDDDNDGILDIDELECSPPFVALGQTFSRSDVSGAINDVWAFSGVSATFDYELIGSNPGTSPGWNSGIQNFNNGVIGPDGEYINVQPNNTDFPNGDVAVYTFTFSETIYDAVFKWGGLDNSDRVDILATNMGANVPVVLTDINLGADVAIMGQTAISTAGGANAPSNSIEVSIQGPFNQLVITAGKNNGAAGNVTMQFYELQYCVQKDTDNDGKPDHIDTDADGDGCPDALEGDGGFNLTDLDANGALTGGVDMATGIPTNAGTGQADVSATNDTVSGGGCDDDGDGLTNNEETTGVDDPSTPEDPNGITTDPNDPDTDGDGISDGQEALDGTDPNDDCDSIGGTPLPDSDCDGDGNPTSTDPNPDTPVAVDDNTTGDVGVPVIFDVLFNDDFIPGPGITLRDLGTGTASGTVSIDPLTGEITYTPTAGENNSTVSIDYEVCNGAVCATATLFIAIPSCTDTDGDNICDALDSAPNDPCEPMADPDWRPVGTSDCDNDGLTYDEEVTGIDDPLTPADPNGVTTDPNDPDTDGDGISDGQEAMDGTDPNDDCDSIGGTPLPDSDCDGDGNPTSTDPNPDTPVAVDDNTTGDVGVPVIFDVLFNDDFIPGPGITLTDLGTGTASGTIAIDPLTGEITYIPTLAEDNSTVSIDYEVCNGTVCDTATLFIAIPTCTDTDGDNICDALDSAPNDPCEPMADPDWRPVGTSDCDNDGLTYDEEVTGIDDPLTPADPNGVTTDPNDPDTDGDGISDGQEALDGTEPNDDCDSVGGTPLGTSDCDNDGLTNDEETTGIDDPSTPADPNGVTTDPNDPDTDGDGISDGQEALDGTDPNDDCDSVGGTPLGTSDCDNDGLTNDEETTGVDDPSTPADPAGNITDPEDPDTDGDGITDGQEALDGTDPNDDCDSVGGTPLGTSDCDNDGLTNDEETTGIDDPSTPADPAGNITDPEDSDTDGDGNIDSVDPNPTVPTANDDSGFGIPNEPVIIDILGNDDYLDNMDSENLDSTTITDTGNGTATGTISFDPDTGELTYIPDPSEAGMTVTIIYEVCNDESGTPICTTATVTITVDVLDSDGDGVTDDQEVLDGTNPNDPCDYVVTSITLTQTGDFLTADCDGDGIDNEQETTDGTDVFDDCDSVGGTPIATSDCDGDGVTNGDEIADGTDPTESCDFILTSASVAPSVEWSTLDCDGDGISNGQEVVDNTDPLDPCSSIGGIPPLGAGCDIEVLNDLVDPNLNDGIFHIENILAFPDNTVEIYNRWGVKVFETRGYDNAANSFRGISNGRATIQENEELPVGIYYYVINYTSNGEGRSRAGYLYINR